MKYLYVKLTGYAGLYNGSGLDSIEIDFTKCKNRITVISGPNGTGKSTIINALHILPDGNENFLPHVEASKIMKLLGEDGNIYDIQILHPLDKHGERSTTRASIQKNGMELNSSGNVSQYKEVVFTEFDMDSNYMELFKISNDRRGLSDKTPGERKKFMSSLISSLDVYNNIYKNLNKKANIFKSYINTISSKITNIGDEAYLRQTLVGLTNKENKLNEVIITNREKIAELRTMINMDDPDGTMNDQYDYIKNNISVYEKRLSEIDSSSLFDDVVLEKKRVELERAKERVVALQQRKNSVLENNSKVVEDINKLEARLMKLNGGSIVGEELETKIFQYESEMKTTEDAFKSVGIMNIDDISVDEINHTIDTVKMIVEGIDNLYQDNDLRVVGKESISTLEKSIKSYYDSIEHGKNLIDEASIKLNELRNAKRFYDILKNRPKNCNIDSCPFIANAMEAISGIRTTSIDKDIEKYESDIENMRNEIVNFQELIQLSEDGISTLRQIDSLTNAIKLNLHFLKKFSSTSRLINSKTFLSDLANHYDFRELRSMTQYYDLANEITQYKSKKKVLEELKSEYIVYMANKNQIDTLVKDIEDLKNNKAAGIEELQRIMNEIDSENEIVTYLLNMITMSDAYNSLKAEYEDTVIKKNEFERKFKNSLQSLTMITDLEDVIKQANEELKQNADSKRTIESQLTLLTSYSIEYNQYKDKYDVINKLRGYSSPTSDSIQALFMSIYMDKTLDMVNQLLQMLFGGNYRIMQYVINDSEFRIPFIGNGLPVDDISSGSTSQKCMMGMIINLVLSSISSGKYNIVSLDEIDGGLDDMNRYQFVEVLHKISLMLNFDQIFIISHSVESALNNVDVVLLSNDQVYLDQFGSANIIYQKGE